MEAIESAASSGGERIVRASVDHLVVLASDLSQGVAWCEATLGVTPSPGGEHPLMGTHNRLLNIASAVFPDCYLELIAINKEAARDRHTSASRWFDMDLEPLQAKITAEGPRLIHFVTRVPRIAIGVAALAALGIDRGPVIEASRATPAGMLRWRISVRDDGQRLFDGALPTLIEWGDAGSASTLATSSASLPSEVGATLPGAARRGGHPVATMPDSGVSLQRLAVRHPQAPLLVSACEAIGLDSVPVESGPARITALLDTPRGRVELRS